MKDINVKLLIEMSNTEKENNYCFVAVLFIILLFSGGILTYACVKYVETKNLETTQCKISKINYPKTIETNTSPFVYINN